MENIKIAIIGAGSSYTPELIEGLINRKDSLPISEVALVDIEEGRKKLNIIHSLAERMFNKAGLSVKITSTLNRHEALKNCSYIITQIRVGGLNARSNDEKIPLKYNTVGQETTGPGGFAKALRTIPVIISIAKEMEELCPNAYLINFTNPAGIVTEAVKQNSKIKCIGLCNVPINMERSVAEHLDVCPEDLYCEFIGLNHLSWIKRVYLKGKDITNELLSQPIFQENIVKNISNVAGMGKLSSTINLIPSPYLNYYYFEKDMIKEEREGLEKGEGTRADKVKSIEKELFEIYSDIKLDKKPKQLSERGGALYSEVAMSLIESIHNNLGRLHVVNVLNNGVIPQLPNDCVIESNCIVNSSGAHPIACDSLPITALSLLSSVKVYEQLTIKAAITGNKRYAFLALLNHPLVHGADDAENLLNDILNANKTYLPHFFNKEVH